MHSNYSITVNFTKCNNFFVYFWLCFVLNFILQAMYYIFFMFKFLIYVSKNLLEILT